MNKPPYESFPSVYDERILLRQINPAEIKDIIEISFYDAKKATSESEALQMLEKINRDYLKGNSIHWGIIEKSTNKIVGTCGFYRGFDNACGELGCVLLPQYQGLGYMTQAMQLAIEFGIKKIELNKIIAITSHYNIRAMNLFNRLGFLKTNEVGNTIQYEYIN